MGPLGRLAHSVFIKRQLEQIFAYRFEKTEALFGKLEGTAPVAAARV
jgi:hypothetical protein